MRKFLIACGVVLAGLVAAPQPGWSANERVIEEWVVKGRHGDIAIDLKWALPANPDMGMYLVLYPKDENFGTSFGLDEAEVAELLVRAFDGMRSSGISVNRLNSISIWLNISGYQKGVNLAIEKKINWRECLRRYSCEKASIAGSNFLKEVSAYKNLDEIFSRYGLRKKSIALGEGAVAMKDGHPTSSSSIVVDFYKAE